MNNENIKLKSYQIGFVLSIILTLCAYYLVVKHIDSGHLVLSHQFLTFALMGLAMIQFVIQLVFFLHLGSESGPRWNLVVFISTISVILVLVIGSIWIMSHLNYNMTPSDMNRMIMIQENIKK